MVFAAASLSEVLPQALAGRAELRFSFDATSRLARQLQAGAPATVFVSADRRWAQVLEDAGVLRDLRVVAHNRLVLVASVDAPARPPAQLAGKRLALAGPEVPAGRYARAALAASGVPTETIASGIAVRHVRAVLAAVAAGEADAGVVYATDARLDPRVRITHTFAAGSHPPIEYVAGRVGGAASATPILDALGSPEAASAWRAHGFSAR